MPAGEFGSVFISLLALVSVPALGHVGSGNLGFAGWDVNQEILNCGKVVIRTSGWHNQLLGPRRACTTSTTENSEMSAGHVCNPASLPAEYPRS